MEPKSPTHEPARQVGFDRQVSMSLPEQTARLGQSGGRSRVGTPSKEKGKGFLQGNERHASRRAAFLKNGENLDEIQGSAHIANLAKVE